MLLLDPAPHAKQFHQHPGGSKSTLNHHTARPRKVIDTNTLLDPAPCWCQQPSLPWGHPCNRRPCTPAGVDGRAGLDEGLFRGTGTAKRSLYCHLHGHVYWPCLLAVFTLYCHIHGHVYCHLHGHAKRSLYCHLHGHLLPPTRPCLLAPTRPCVHPHRGRLPLTADNVM